MLNLSDLLSEMLLPCLLCYYFASGPHLPLSPLLSSVLFSSLPLQASQHGPGTVFTSLPSCHPLKSSTLLQFHLLLCIGLIFFQIYLFVTKMKLFLRIKLFWYKSEVRCVRIPSSHLLSSTSTLVLVLLFLFQWLTSVNFVHIRWIQAWIAVIFKLFLKKNLSSTDTKKKNRGSVVKTQCFLL